MDKLLATLKSRRVIAAAVGLGVVVVGQPLGLSDEQITKVTAVIVTYILGESFRKSA